MLNFTVDEEETLMLHTNKIRKTVSLRDTGKLNIKCEMSQESTRAQR